MRRFLVVSLAVLTLAGCVPPPQAPEPAPRPVVTPAPQPTPPPLRVPLSSEWNDWPFTPGDWTYRSDERGSTAAFGVTGNETAITLRCDRARGVLQLLMRGRPGDVTVRTTTLSRTLTLSTVGWESGIVAVQFGASDNLLDAMAFSRGRFVVERAGQPPLVQPPLVLPPYAEIGRVIEDCRG